MQAERFALVLGGALCLFVTPFLALAYFPAYGSFTELPPPWADWVDWPELVTGDAVSVYNTYGTVYGVGLLIVAISLFVLVRRSTEPGSGERRAWNVAVGGLGLAAVGSIFEYAFDLLPGFLLELLGFPVLIAGMAMLGATLRRNGNAPVWKWVVVSLSGLAAVALGGALVGHLPSGPAFVPVIACVVFGFTGLPLATPRVRT